MNLRHLAGPLSLVLACCVGVLPASSQTSYDESIHDYITASQQRELARAALAQYGIVPDVGHGPEVDVRLVFPSTQTGLDNVEMTMLEPVSSGAHECMAIAVKTSDTTIESYFHAKKDARPGHLYDVVVSDSMGDKFWVGRILVSREAVQKYVINAPMLTPGSPHYGGPNSAPAPKLGIFGEQISPSFLRQAHIENARARGILVIALWPNGAAQRWGVRVGDVILGFNGHAVGSIGQLAQLEASASNALLAVARAGRILTLGAAAGQTYVPSAKITWDSPQGKALIRSWIVPVPSLGLNILPVTQQLMDLMPNPSSYAGVHGVIILNVAPNSWAYTAGFQNEDVVWAVNGHSFTNVQAFLQLVSEFRDELQFSLYRGGHSITLSGGDSGWQPPAVGPGFVPPATPPPAH